MTSLLVSILLTRGRCGSKTPKAERVLKPFSEVSELTTVLLGKAGLYGALSTVELCLLRGYLLNQVTQAGLAGRIPCA